MTQLELLSVMRVVHIVTAVLMAWPFYALVAVNQRVKLGPPLGDRADTYMENIIKNRTIPCFIFQITALVSGLVLLNLRGQDLGFLLSNAAVGLKFLLLLVIMGMLAYVHFNMQPKIDQLFAQVSMPIPEEIAAQIGALRARRKLMASVCMFIVLMTVMLGMQVWTPFPVWLTVALTVALFLFTYRAYTSETPYGWV
jgi:hypothetical protein